MGKNKIATISKPSVSIVTITQKKRFECLLILFEIIKQQTYKNIIEWVLVEGSQLTEDRIENNSNITQLINLHKDTVKFKFIYINNSNRLNDIIKLGELRNIGNAVCNGDITVCMDDDDFYFKNRIEHVVHKLTKSACKIAGCTKHLMYDYDMNILVQMYSCGKNHSINSFMAWKKDYLINHSHDITKSISEEASFTNNFSEPMVQLDPYSVGIISSHNSNSVSKTNLILNSLMTDAMLGIKDNNTDIQIINTPITNFIKKDLFEKYSDIFLSKSNNTSKNYLSSSSVIAVADSGVTSSVPVIEGGSEPAN
jgi:hypothetical protein